MLRGVFRNAFSARIQKISALDVFATSCLGCCCDILLVRSATIMQTTVLFFTASSLLHIRCIFYSLLCTHFVVFRLKCALPAFDLPLQKTFLRLFSAFANVLQMDEVRIRYFCLYSLLLALLPLAGFVQAALFTKSLRSLTERRRLRELLASAKRFRQIYLFRRRLLPLFVPLL